MNKEPIIITVQGGVVQDIENIPAGVVIHVHDYDVEGEDTSALPKNNDGDHYNLGEYEHPSSAASNMVGVLEVSTGNITAEDGKLIEMPSSPLRMGEHDEGYGALFSVPTHVPGSPDFKDYAKQLRDFGYSEAFIAVFAAAVELKANYIYFDRDNDPLEGFQVFDW